MRIGFGYDVHRLAVGRPLILGGVSIPFDKGLLGHSDADVLVHAACDALLGAAGLGDLGQHFPDTEAAYKDVYSIELLKASYAMVRTKGYHLVNLDAVIIAQAPKMAPHREAMEQTMADALDCAKDRINVKATTTEGLGFCGTGEGIAAKCMVLIAPVS
jgi:2-C-methyl-D-erythritol 2,4-cyclodiphosphate synthase